VIDENYLNQKLEWVNTDLKR